MIKNFIIIVLLLIGLSNCAKENQVKNDIERPVSDKTLTLKIQMNAKEIYLAGNFNFWKVKDPVYQFKTNDGKNWELTLTESKFKKGKNEYKLIVDGDWKINPNEKTEDSSLSGKINVFEIK